MRIAYSVFSNQPDASQLTDYPGASLWYLLDGELLIQDHTCTLLQQPFPLFRLAALLQYWLAYRPAPLPEARLLLEDYENQAAVVIRRQTPDVALVWTEAGHDLRAVTVPETEFARASQAFLQQLQVDLQVQFGIDMRPLLTGIPF